MEGPRDLRHLPWWLRYQVGAWAASEARRLLVRATHRHCGVAFQGPVHLGPGFSLDIPHTGTLVVGADAEFRRGFHCEIVGAGRVEIGARTTFTSHGLIQCATTIEIGDDCMFAQSALVVDGFHRFRDPNRLIQEQGFDLHPVRIGDGVLVAAKCTIGADIGRRSVIGANSVVIRPIPAYCFAAGAPARVIEYFGPADERPPDLDVRPTGAPR